MNRKLAKWFFYISVVLTAVLLLLIFNKARRLPLFGSLLLFLIGLFGTPYAYIVAKEDYDKYGYVRVFNNGIIMYSFALLVGAVMLLIELFNG